MRATVGGLVAVLIILAFNIGVIYFIISHATKKTTSTVSTIVTSPDQLGQIGSAQGPAGQNLNLIVTPNAQFKGQVTIDKALGLGDKLTAPSASLSQLQAGNSSISQLNVNGTSSLTDASLRGNLNVAGTSALQGPVSITKLLTVAAINVTGNLSVGGALSTSNFSARSLTAVSSLTIGGHIITAGSAPSLSRGSALVPTDSISIGGNDVAGTLVLGISSGHALSGKVMRVNFVSAYSVRPHVVVTPNGAGCGNLGVYVENITSSGFDLGIDGPSSGSISGQTCQFEYEVMQ